MKRKITILIADDEAIQREMLCKTLPWEENGFEVCGEARNGMQALELCQQLHPDIALVDINMPGMNGVEMIRSLRTEHMDTHVVIISGHDEFAYAREAISLNVEEYLLKPINEEELLRVMNRLKENIFNQKKHEEYIQKISQHAEEDFKRLQRDFLYALITTTQHEEEMERQAERFDIPFRQPLSVVALEMEQLSTQTWNSNDQAVCRYGVANVLSETLESLGQTYVFESGINTLCAVVINQNPAEVLQYCQKAYDYIENQLHVHISAGIGVSQKGLSGVKEAYEQAVYSGKHGAVLGFDRVVDYQTLLEECVTVNFSPTQRESLKRAMRSNMVEEAHEQIHMLFGETAGSRASLKSVQNLVDSVLSALSEFLEEYSVESSFLSFSFRELEQIFSGFHGWSDIVVWLNNYVDRCVELADDKAKLSLHVERAKKYIGENYGNCNLRVGDIARQVYLNESYLSTIFNRFTGVSVVEYITDVRLSNAKMLMDQGEDNVGSIAEQVGYLDSNYFSKCFKKKYGMSPRRYRSMRR